jgi:hypothetical protein
MLVCKYFLGKYEFKEGGLCDYRHEWGSNNGRGRCWNCGSTKFLKLNCPANGIHEGNPKLRAAIEVVLESEAENTEPDLERKRPTLLVFFCKGIYIRKSFGCQ